MGKYYTKQFTYTSHLIHTRPCDVDIINILVVQMPWRRLYFEESSEWDFSTPRYVWLDPILSTIMAHPLSLLSLKSPGDIGSKHSCPPLAFLRILSRLNILRLSSPKYMISTFPSLVILLYPRSTCSMPHFKGVPITPPRQFRGPWAFYPSVRWNEVSVGSHFMFRLNSNPRVFCCMIFSFVKPCFPILCLSIVCLELYIHFNLHFSLFKFHL